MLLRQNLLDSSSVRSSSLQSTFDIFNPMKITNNLVILPLNATVNGVRNLGTSTNRWLAAPSLSVPSISVPSLKVPLYLNPFGETESRATAPVTSPRANAVESSADVDSGHTDNDTEEQPIGTFLVGLVANIHDPSTIHNKLVYLQNKDDNTYAEYLLVIYERDNVVVTLIYESSYGLLKVASFYEELTSSSLEPLIEEIFSSTGGGGGSHLGTTAGSLSSLPRSLNGYPGSDDVQEFFFIIFDPKEKSVQSSFPYLQKHEFTLVISVDHTTRLQNRLNNTVYFLHDILIDVFLVQGGDEFLNSENSTMREYFHKFNGGRLQTGCFIIFNIMGNSLLLLKIITLK